MKVEELYFVGALFGIRDAKGIKNRVTKSMVKFEFHLPRGRNVTISITDDDPKLW